MSSIENQEPTWNTYLGEKNEIVENEKKTKPRINIEIKLNSEHRS